MGRLLFPLWRLHPSRSLLYCCRNLWQHSSSPKVIWHPSPPSPPLQSICLSLSRSLLLLSFCASSSWSGRSGARVAVATCPIPIAGWIIPGLCFPRHIRLPTTHTQDQHTCHAVFITSPSFNMAPPPLKNTILSFFSPSSVNPRFPESAKAFSGS